MEEIGPWAKELKDACVLLSRQKAGIRTPPSLRSGVKVCAELGRKKVTYFRGKDFSFTMELRRKHPIYLRNFGAMLDRKLEIITPEITKEVMEILLKQRILSKSKSAPLAANTKPKKWPDRIVRTHDIAFDTDLEEDEYYIFNYEEPNPYQGLMVAGVIVIPLLLIMFPVWPLWIKISIWYACVFFLVFLFGFLLVRFVIFLLIWVGGWEFWVLPNIFDDTIPWFDAWKPLFSFDRTEEDEGFLVIRAMFLLLGYICCLELSKSSFELEDLRWPVDEVIDWGLNKLAPPVGGPLMKLPKLEELEAEEEASKAAAKIRPQTEASTEGGGPTELSEHFGGAEKVLGDRGGEEEEGWRKIGEKVAAQGGRSRNTASTGGSPTSTRTSTRSSDAGEDVEGQAL